MSLAPNHLFHAKVDYIKFQCLKSQHGMSPRDYSNDPKFWIVVAMEITRWTHKNQILTLKFTHSILSFLCTKKTGSAITLNSHQHDLTSFKHHVDQSRQFLSMTIIKPVNVWRDFNKVIDDPVHYCDFVLFSSGLKFLPTKFLQH